MGWNRRSNGRRARRLSPSLPSVIDPRLFSFNSPYGACPDCHGLGTRTEFDPLLIVPNRNLSVAEGAVRYFVYKSGKEIMSDHRTAMFRGVAQKLGFAMETPIKEL